MSLEVLGIEVLELEGLEAMILSELTVLVLDGLEALVIWGCVSGMGKQVIGSSIEGLEAVPSWDRVIHCLWCML